MRSLFSHEYIYMKYKVQILLYETGTVLTKYFDCYKTADIEYNKADKLLAELDLNAEVQMWKCK